MPVGVEALATEVLTNSVCVWSLELAGAAPAIVKELNWDPLETEAIPPGGIHCEKCVQKRCIMCGERRGERKRKRRVIDKLNVLCL